MLDMYDDGSEFAFAPAIQKYTSNSSFFDGRKDVHSHGLMFCECHNITRAQHDAAILDPDVTYFDIDGLSLDDPISALSNRAAIRQFLENHHIPVDDLTGSDPIRRLVRRIIKRMMIRQILHEDDELDGLDSTLANNKKQRIIKKLADRGINIDATLTKREILKFISSRIRLKRYGD